MLLMIMTLKNGVRSVGCIAVSAKKVRSTAAAAQPMNSFELVESRNQQPSGWARVMAQLRLFQLLSWPAPTASAARIFSIVVPTPPWYGCQCLGGPQFCECFLLKWTGGRRTRKPTAVRRKQATDMGIEMNGAQLADWVQVVAELKVYHRQNGPGKAATARHFSSNI
ncbi:hypothetical protein niasHT_012407 [Heterodera trifolii]|uniref:Uncharacterized protein n=1 Tax=Heterodera trifolii TaxID=157864 RepID=A0ABD2L9X6_9BILA